MRRGCRNITLFFLFLIIGIPFLSGLLGISQSEQEENLEPANTALDISAQSTPTLESTEIAAPNLLCADAFQFAQVAGKLNTTAGSASWDVEFDDGFGCMTEVELTEGNATQLGNTATVYMTSSQQSRVELIRLTADIFDPSSENGALASFEFFASDIVQLFDIELTDDLRRVIASGRDAEYSGESITIGVDPFAVNDGYGLWVEIEP